jgi:hypothetical protein
MYTQQGKTRPTCHTFFTLSPCMDIDHMYLMWSTYSNLSRAAGRFGRIPLLSRKKGFWHNPQHVGWLIYKFVPSFSHKPTNEAVVLSQAPIDDKLLGLLDPYTSMRGYVQYLLAGGNLSIFNRHRRGLQPWRCWLPIYHSPTFQTRGLHFPPKCSAQSPV